MMETDMNTVTEVSTQTEPNNNFKCLDCGSHNIKEIVIRRTYKDSTSPINEQSEIQIKSELSRSYYEDKVTFTDAMKLQPTEDKLSTASYNEEEQNSMMNDIQEEDSIDSHFKATQNFVTHSGVTFPKSDESDSDTEVSDIAGYRLMQGKEIINRNRTKHWKNIQQKQSKVSDTETKSLIPAIDKKKKISNVCEICDASFENQYHQMARHIKEHYGYKAPFHCKVCDKKFPFIQSIRRHMRIYKGKVHYACSKCRRTFYKKDMYEKHKSYHDYRPDEKRAVAEQEDADTDVDNSDFCSLEKEECKPVQDNQQDIHGEEIGFIGDSDTEVEETDSDKILMEIVEEKICQGDGNANTCLEKDGDKLMQTKAPGKTVDSKHRGKRKSFNSSPKNHICEVCDVAFDKQCKLSIHLRRHYGERPPFHCKICGKYFSFLTAVRKHTRIYKGKAHYACDKCPRTFDKKRVYEKHKKYHDKPGSDDTEQNLKESVIDTEECSMETQPDKILKHTDRDKTPNDENLNINIHKQRKHEKECNFPGDVLETITEIRDGSVNTLPETSRPKESQSKDLNDSKYVMVCEACDAVFTNQWDMAYHLKEHFGESPPYRCHICAKDFSFMKALRKHLRLYKDKETHYGCNKCRATFDKKDAYERHKLYHETDDTGKRKQRFECSYCEKTFKNISHLSVHEKGHTDGKRFMCRYCGAEFTAKHKMKLHENRHTGEGKNKCSECDLYFRDGPSLKLHLKTQHSDNKPYLCGTCGLAFKTRSGMKRHEETRHLGVRYPCTKCDQVFSQQVHVRKHDEVKHSIPGILNFLCEICSKRFRRKEHLKNHLLTHAKRKEVNQGSLADLLT